MAPQNVPQPTLPTRNETKRDKGTQGGSTHFGTTGSSRPLAASTASFHRAVHRHHLQPGSRPIDRRLLPREALKSRNSFVRTPAGREGICGQRRCLATEVGGAERDGGDGRRTGDGVVAAIFGAHATVAVAVVARHGLLGEEGEGLLEDCPAGGWVVSIDVDRGAEWKLPARRRWW